MSPITVGRIKPAASALKMHATNHMSRTMIRSLGIWATLGPRDRPHVDSLAYVF